MKGQSRQKKRPGMAIQTWDSSKCAFKINLSQCGVRTFRGTNMTIKKGLHYESTFFHQIQVGHLVVF